MSQLTDFLQNNTPDHAGRYLADIWAFDARQLEYHHDYIQWLFPLDTPSPNNWQAPVLTKADQALCQQNQTILANILRSYQMMLDFYGVQLLDNQVVVKPEVDIRDYDWLSHFNHNQLRLTRMIRSLSLVGLTREAQALQQGILSIAEQYGDVNANTIHYWRDALIR